MFVDKNTPFNEESLRQEIAKYMNRDLKDIGSIEEIVALIELEHLYRAALEEISTKLRILDEDFQIK
ncbi:TPA: GTP pyrophosphokinase family protein, partial [Staphylococcus pseudintermedius]|nr:GTP pyrophosphokinase family protein [Staphylococcus pseudintermedius]